MIDGETDPREGRKAAFFPLSEHISTKVMLLAVQDMNSTFIFQSTTELIHKMCCQAKTKKMKQKV